MFPPFQHFNMSVQISWLKNVYPNFCHTNRYLILKRQFFCNANFNERFVWMSEFWISCWTQALLLPSFPHTKGKVEICLNSHFIFINLSINKPYFLFTCMGKPFNNNICLLNLCFFLITNQKENYLQKCTTNWTPSNCFWLRCAFIWLVFLNENLCLNHI